MECNQNSNSPEPPNSEELKFELTETEDSTVPTSTGASKYFLSSSASTSKLCSSEFSERSSSSPSVRKILSQNYNGTVVLTTSPSNDAELQLYRIMQRASLLVYYDTLLEMGGDDVNQLCDAGEEEFLEIMALVGMASKPLHVRRFQKALQEWISNPTLFQTPLASSESGMCVLPRPLSVHSISSSPGSVSSFLVHPQPMTPASSPSSSVNQQLGEISSCTPCNAASPVPGPSCSTSPAPILSPSSLQQQQQQQQQQANPLLDEGQMFKLEEAAKRLVNSLPELEPKYGAKKKVGKDLEAVLNMSEDDPERMNLIRKYSAIYGRFDCKRKPEKPLTLHEVSVNEAAAQICRYVPALLTRRDELFPLARQVVRDSGYHYSKGHSKSMIANYLPRISCNESLLVDQQPAKKRWKASQSFSENSDHLPHYRQDRLEQISMELQHIGCKVEELSSDLEQMDKRSSEYLSVKYQKDVLETKRNQLLQEHAIIQNSFDNNRCKKRKYSTGNNSETSRGGNDDNIDDTDSQFSYSNAGSPYQDATDFRGSNQDEEIENTDKAFQVVATRGNNIIAVKNPALISSSTEKEPLSPILNHHLSN